MRDFTEIVMVLDRSGSMESRRDDVIGGYNNFVQQQKDAGPNAALTLVTFDDQSVETVQDHRVITEVSALTRDNYVPRGGTPLLDTLGKVIKETGQYLKGLRPEARPDKVVFVIVTDGQENASRRFTKGQISEMIAHQESVYNWQFVYLGANQDAFAEAAGLGIRMDAASSFRTDRFIYAMGASGSNVADYRKSGQAQSLNYSGAQRSAMTDADDPNVVKPTTTGGK